MRELIIDTAVNISGIRIQDSTNIQIKQNTNNEHMSGVGIFLNRSTDIAITSLKIQGMGFGVLHWEGGGDVMVENSSFQDCLYILDYIC